MGVGGVSFLMSNRLTTMPGGLWPDKNFPGKMVSNILGSFYNAEGARKMVSNILGSFYNAEGARKMVPDISDRFSNPP